MYDAVEWLRRSRSWGGVLVVRCVTFGVIGVFVGTQILSSRSNIVQTRVFRLPAPERGQVRDLSNIHKKAEG